MTAVNNTAGKIKNKILNHPDRDLIFKMIGEGRSDRDIEAFLKQKYPLEHHAHLRMTHKTIYNFRSEFMPNGVLSKIALSEAAAPKWIKQNREIAAELAKNSAYQDLLAKVAEEEINTKRELINLMTVLKSRMETYYNALAGNGKLDERNEKILLEQMKLLLGILQHQDRATTAGGLGTGDVNVNISIVKDHASIIRDAIRETLSEVDPNLCIEFMERINLKMKELEYSETTGIIPLNI